ncbi:MAG TPA: ribosome-associated translation inhibitor RaiA [Longimicrobiales bacterium]|nr:ribosome-associated translation inhibitor RaiA [Longimicrobiales bacterium]
MDVQITIRRGRAGEGFRALAEEKARKLEKYEPRLIRVELLFERDGGRSVGEVRAMVPGLPALVSKAEAESRRTALDRVMQKAARQLRKERSRRVEHKALPVTGLVE